MAQKIPMSGKPLSIFCSTEQEHQSSDAAFKISSEEIAKRYREILQLRMQLDEAETRRLGRPN